MFRVMSVLYLSPLSKIPGPILDTLFPGITDVYHLLRGTAAQHILKQHQRYGPVVRLGPNNVSITAPADWKKILGSHRFKKYTTARIKCFGAQNTFTTYDPGINQSRRRLIKPAFTTTHIAVMEQRILQAGPMSMKRKIDEAIRNAKERSNNNNNGGGGGRDYNSTKINYVDWFHYMTFDVIGELAFGASFGMLQKGDYMMLEGIKALNTLGIYEIYIPYFGQFENVLVPGLVKKVERLLDFTKSVVAKRKRQISNNPLPTESPPPHLHHQDILQVFINNTDQETSGTKLSEPELISELTAQLFGGTDTSSNTLSWTLFLLMVYPSTYHKVCKEIRTAFPDKPKPITYTEGLPKLPYLEAVIYESMRFLPTTSGRLCRKIPESSLPASSTGGGHVLSNGGKYYYLPPGTEISIPIYSINHDSTLWKDHHVFLPERFYATETNSIQDVAARKKNLLTFSSGVRICPGRNLAMCEIFMTLANLLRDYEFWLPPEMAGKYGPDVIDKDTGQPKIIPGFLGITFTPKCTERDGWICVKHNTTQQTTTLQLTTAK
ncbi:hypothetical protein H4219_004142 [Mycoemilia scoparia]|uniref:Cytochrome P450 n=1 Tax=Mycoemilia scoparia TaxID=417184 RepID=A0A9W8DRL7_9FUNG|nr:hypothetical protein H4219_004142 [Mycoemilia scoparia]